MAYHFVAFDDSGRSQTVEGEAAEQIKGNKLSHELNDGLLNSIDGVKSLVSDDTDDCCDIDCCEGDCFCPANACTSMVYVDNTLALSKLILNSELALSFVQASPQYIVSSLYRPPIFTS
ncbi:hypothetical protein RS130_21890 [Paraglaciecola aquimarina]|uniref:Uncharacterized protein n=1 Tax=Paraglaciecola aquimarina TaxID=1235557 RepID=A0ABU3T1N5_9ALTE|nr:hypothetical protein [Paraglaciecola aquimarina]MDU0356176.1 hypothetical protein [Paraglaciecola aquimarina]